MVCLNLQIKHTFKAKGKSFTLKNPDMQIPTYKERRAGGKRGSRRRQRWADASMSRDLGVMLTATVYAINSTHRTLSAVASKL